MPARRTQWAYCDLALGVASPISHVAASSQVVARGKRVKVYQGAIIYGNAVATVRTGGPTGDILMVLGASGAGAAGGGGTDRDPIDNQGGHVEFPDGVYIQVSGPAMAVGVLIDCGEDP